MEPKILSAINFLESGGEKVIISSIENSIDIFHKNKGTVILKE